LLSALRLRRSFDLPAALSFVFASGAFHGTTWLHLRSEQDLFVRLRRLHRLVFMWRACISSCRCRFLECTWLALKVAAFSMAMRAVVYDLKNREEGRKEALDLGRKG
jgi:hypothetical protein